MARRHSTDRGPSRRIFGDSLFQVLSVSTETEGARNAIDVLTATLWIFAAVATARGLNAVAIVTFRQVGNVERDQEMLAALGLTARQRATAAGSVAVFAAIVGGVFAVGAAALTSPMFPMGLARKAEVDPGFRIDGRVLGLGLVAIVAFVASVAAIASWRVAVSVTRDRDARAVRRPSTVTRAAANAGASPVLTTGLRMALEPGRGATAVPLRSAVHGRGTRDARDRRRTRVRREPRPSRRHPAPLRLVVGHRGVVRAGTTTRRNDCLHGRDDRRSLTIARSLRSRRSARNPSRSTATR